MTAPHVPILRPEQLAISLGTPLDGRSKTVVSDLINPYGFVVFRGYDVSSDQEFHDFIECFGLPNFTYAESFSNAVRRNRTPRVFTANEAPPEIEIFLHHEMAQTLVFPGQLFFFCEQAPSGGGATPIGRSDLALVELEKARPDFVAKLRSLGVRYRNAMPESADLASGQGRSWRDTLNVADRKQAEQRLTELGYNFRWLDDGGISVQTPALLAVDEFGRGKDVLFNQIVAAAAGWINDESDEDPRLCYGDYSRIDQADLDAAIAASYEHTVDLEWQTGDIALLDNLKVMHGRRPFSGSRSILASLCTPISRPSLAL
jgi:alpha-ketoglutarate-dependent taurine dioxygenase